MLTFLSIISWTVYVNSSNYVMIMMNSVEKIDNSLWPLVSFSPSYCISPAPRPLFLTECVSPLSFHHHLPHRVGKAISNIQAAHMYTYYTYKTHTHTTSWTLSCFSDPLCIYSGSRESEAPGPELKTSLWKIELRSCDEWNKIRADLPVRLKHRSSRGTTYKYKGGCSSVKT